MARESLTAVSPRSRTHFCRIRGGRRVSSLIERVVKRRLWLCQSAGQKPCLCCLRGPWKDQVAVGLNQAGALAFIGEAIEKVGHEREARALLVVALNHTPGRRFMRGTSEHVVAGLGIGFPFFARDSVDRGDLPGLQRVPAAIRETFLLLLAADVEIIFPEGDACPHQQGLEVADALEEA